MRTRGDPEAFSEMERHSFLTPAFKDAEEKDKWAECVFRDRIVAKGGCEGRHC